ncbi:MAG: NAD(+) synthase [Clostridia bacterium]|nr:NAD(+) synthase [Clostridia bacterium]
MSKQIEGYIRIAAAAPRVKVADCPHNTAEMEKMIREASENGAAVIVFPELSVTGYTCGDLFRERKLIQSAQDCLLALIENTKDLDILCAVGLPVAAGGALYNCAAVFCRGELLALPAKQHIPNYNETDEARWFTPAPENGMIRFDGDWYDCRNVLFDLGHDAVVGVEIADDLFAAEPVSTRLALGGATILLNLACSNEMVGRADYRRDLVRMHSGRLAAAYAYADAGFGESTTDMVFAGHRMICENAEMIRESKLFETGILYGDVDVERLIQDRRRMSTWKEHGECVVLEIGMKLPAFDTDRVMYPFPFIPKDSAELAARCESILQMQAAGLAGRLGHIGCKTAVIGLSGGLDSTLALLVTARAFDLLGYPRDGIRTVSMPCFGTTKRTKSNAQYLAEELQVDFREIPITAAVEQHFKDIGHDPSVLDVTFENAQARERTQVLMDFANRFNGIVIGTGDLSELALGWATYNGDHMSMYGVNGSIPKTLVRHLVRHIAMTGSDALRRVLLDILDTPVSPELLPPKDGEIAQKTEDLVGPYELHDYFLYYMMRFGFTPGKIYAMAERSFAGVYDADTIKKWLRTFYRRFFTQQFKRSCLPDGPKVGSVTLSPRGDFHMPSDASFRIWMEEIEKL